MTDSRLTRFMAKTPVASEGNKKLLPVGAREMRPVCSGQTGAACTGVFR